MTDSPLPDIDTAAENIEYLAFYNAISQGDVGQIDPEEMLSNESLLNYQLFDNGWHGQYQAGHRTVEIRAKTDGWVVAYLTREREFAAGVNEPPAGSWDIVQNWATWEEPNSGSPPTDSQPIQPLSRNRLERAIHDLLSELSNWDLINYTPSAVGVWYGYNDTASGVTALAKDLRSHGGDNKTATETASYTVTDPTQLIDLAVLGDVKTNWTQDTDHNPTEMSWEGLTAASIWEGREYAALNVLNESPPSAGETQSITLSVDSPYGGGTHSVAKGTVVALWGSA
jgi:hypothetical protein